MHLMRRIHTHQRLRLSKEVTKRKGPSSELIQTVPDLYEPYVMMKESKAIGLRRKSSSAPLLSSEMSTKCRTQDKLFPAKNSVTSHPLYYQEMLNTQTVSRSKHSSTKPSLGFSRPENTTLIMKTAKRIPEISESDENSDKCNQHVFQLKQEHDTKEVLQLHCTM